MQVERTRTYDELCEAGRLAAVDGDAANWTIGDLACEVVTAYAEHTLADFAREIGKPKGTVYECRQMSGFFEPSERAEILAEYPNITRSHMRKCLPLHSLDMARFALDKCSTRGWTVDHFGLILKRYRYLKGITPRPVAAPSPEPLGSFEATFMNSMPGAVALLSDDWKALQRLLAARPDARVVVTVYER